MRNLRRPRGDYPGMTPRGASGQDRRIEALLTGHGAPTDTALLGVLADLHLLGAGPAPQPSAALNALLSGVTPLPTHQAEPARATTGRQRSKRRPLRAVVLSVVVGLSVLTVGAAANALPPDVQRTVAHLLDTVTPFHFPSPPPRPHPPTPSQPTTAPSPSQLQSQSPAARTAGPPVTITPSAPAITTSSPTPPQGLSATPSNTTPTSDNTPVIPPAPPRGAPGTDNQPTEDSPDGQGEVDRTPTPMVTATNPAIDDRHDLDSDTSTGDRSDP